MKLSKHDTNLLLVLVGLLVFLGAYLGIANRYNAKTEELQEEITALYPRLEELRTHSANLPVYEAGIDESIANVEAELARYPTDVRPEDLVMYAIELRDNVDRQRQLLACRGGFPLPDSPRKSGGSGGVRSDGSHENRLFHQLRAKL